MGKLSGKTAIITGASSGFGRGTALAFAREGANLVLTARREERLREVCASCEELGAKAVYVAGDVNDELTAMACVAKANQEFGQVDILDNNAGIGEVKDLLDETVEDYDRVMDTNVRSAFIFTRAVVPQMLERGDGQIILTSSVTGVKGAGDEPAYTMSKFALRGFGQSLERAYQKRGVRTCVFCPHAGHTEFEVGNGRTEEELDKRSFLTGEDVGEALVAVCSMTPNCHISELRLASNDVCYI